MIIQGRCLILVHKIFKVNNPIQVPNLILEQSKSRAIFLTVEMPLKPSKRPFNILYSLNHAMIAAFFAIHIPVLGMKMNMLKLQKPLTNLTVAMLTMPYKKPILVPSAIQEKQNIVARFLILEMLSTQERNQLLVTRTITLVSLVISGSNM